MKPYNFSYNTRITAFKDAVRFSQMHPFSGKMLYVIQTDQPSWYITDQKPEDAACCIAITFDGYLYLRGAA